MPAVGAGHRAPGMSTILMVSRGAARLAPGSHSRPAVGLSVVCALLSLGLAVSGQQRASSATAPAATQAGAPAAPDYRALFERVRDNLERDETASSQFTYRLLRRSYEVSALGKVTNGPEQLYEVVPSPSEPSRSYRRLLAVNGRALSPEELRANDERHRQAVEDTRKKRARETPDEHARRLTAERRERAEMRAQLEDAYRVFRIDVAGREMQDGRSLLVVTLTPRPDAKPVTDAGDKMRRLRGRAWVDDDAAQLVRVDFEAAEDITLGWGIVGRINQGSRGTYRRAPLPDGAWVPVEARFSGTGRTLMFRPFDIQTFARYQDYRRWQGGASGEP